MSHRSQIALGRNSALQKQFEDQCVNIRYRFKHSRRRQDAFEEECVDSLYKLLLFAKDNNGEMPAKGDNSSSATGNVLRPRRPQSVLGIQTPKKTEVVDKQRPSTAMSARDYTQSYSFQKDGMNIDRSRRDRYLRNKQEKAKAKELNLDMSIKFQDITKDKRDLEETLMENFQGQEHTEIKNVLQLRPKTAGPEHLSNQTSSRPGLLQRPATRNTLLRVEPTPSDATAPSAVDAMDLSNGTVERNTPVSQRPSKQSQSLKKTRTPSLVVIDTSQPTSNDKHSVVNSKVAAKQTIDAPASRTSSAMDNALEELIPLSDKDKNHLDALTETVPSRTVSRLQSRAGTRLSVDLPVNDTLSKGVEKTRVFLNQYSKKSRILGYVLKTRSARISRERLRSYRSPCITYQELVSIKANIKQHVSKTRSLLHRSAKLSSYVDKLATASEHRAFSKQLNVTHS